MKKNAIGWLGGFILLVVGLSFGGCNSLFKGNNPYYKISAEFKNFCYFDAGSQWTYQNDSTGTQYNVTVKSINSYVGFQASNATNQPFNFDVIEMRLDTNAFDMIKENIYATNPISIPDTTKLNDLFRLFYAHGIDTTFVLAFAPQYKLQQPELLGGQEGIYTNMEILPYYLIGQTRYNNVYHSRDVFPEMVNGVASNDSVTMNFYIAEHYGIIKWTSLYKGKTTSYSLVSSDLIQ